MNEVDRCEREVDHLQKRHQDEKRQRQIKKLQDRIAYLKMELWKAKGHLAEVKHGK